MKMSDKTILLVEDNPDDEALTIRALKRANIGNPVEVARDGVQAIERLFGRSSDTGSDPIEYPALILLDLKLPRVDGLEVLRKIRTDSRTQRIPVVILTSSNETHDIAESYSNGCNSYIRKPVNSESFFEAVKQLGLYWLVLNEPPRGNEAKR
jgi:two-component system response regulator